MALCTMECAHDALFAEIGLSIIVLLDWVFTEHTREYILDIWEQTFTSVRTVYSYRLSKGFR